MTPRLYASLLIALFWSSRSCNAFSFSIEQPKGAFRSTLTPTALSTSLSTNNNNNNNNNNNSTTASSTLGYEEETETVPGRRRVRGPIRLSSFSRGAQVQIDRKAAAQQRQITALQDITLLDNATYHSVNPSAVTLRALTEVCGVDRMTIVQSRTYAKVLQGTSVLAISKTGTGKTLAALVPLMELIFSQPSNAISLLVLAPTRELAQQIGATANHLVTFRTSYSNKHSNKHSLIQVVYGGTNIMAQVRALERHLPRILIATPGRLVELLDTKVRGRQLQSVLQQSLRHIYLDEADLLLDSFPTELLKVTKALPRRRQVLLFSATWPKSKHGDFVQKHVIGEPLTSDLRETFVELNCVVAADHINSGFSNPSSPANSNVQEYFLQLSSMDSYLETLLSILQQEISWNPQAKIIVFFPAAKMVQLLARLVKLDGATQISAIHSRMSQAQRQRVSQAFRNTNSAILFSSDISARGMDYPNVTTVLQYGLPNNRELYCHRLGRTARAGQYGKSILVSLPFEPDTPPWLPKRSKKKKKPILPLYHVSEADIGQSYRTNLSLSSRPLSEQAQAAYKAFVAYYIGTGHYDASTVLSAAQGFANTIGLTDLPELPETLSSLVE